MKRLFICAVALAAAVCACKTAGGDTNSQLDRINASFTRDKVAVYANPDSMLTVFAAQAAHETDSVCLNCWKVILAKTQFIGFHDPQADSLSREVVGFCRRNPGLEGTANLVCEAENLLGILCQYAGQKDSAIAHLSAAYQAGMRTPGRESCSNICINIADNLNHVEEFPLAASWLRRALSLADSLQQSSQYCAVNTSLGQTCSELGNYALADEHFSAALRWKDKGTPNDPYLIYAALGNSNFKRKDYEEALKWFRLAQGELPALGGNPLTTAIVAGNMGEVFLSLGQTDSAEFYINEAYPFFTSNPYSDPGTLYYMHGLKGSLETARGNLAQAQRYFDLADATPERRSDYLRTMNNRKMRLCELQGNWKGAYALSRENAAYDDSLRSLSLLAGFADAQQRYSRDTTLLHSQIKLAEQNSRLTKLRFSLAALAAVMILVGTVLLLMRRRRRERDAALADSLSSLRLRNARKIVSPHFVFNVLNAAKGELGPEGKEMLPSLLRLLRSNVDYSSRTGIPLSEELQMARDEVALLQAMGRGDVGVEWDIDEAAAPVTVPYGCVQTNVENAFKHAFPKSVPGALVKVRCTLDADALRITVSDNGCGLGGEPAHGGSGTGILRSTLTILNRYNQRKASFDLTSSAEGAGTTATIIIPTGYNFTIKSNETDHNSDN